MNLSLPKPKSIINIGGLLLHTTQKINRIRRLFMKLLLGWEVSDP